MRRILLLALALASLGAQAHARNLIVFVADGLRSRIVTEETAPALQAVRREGVDFRNSHSLYPTITTPNASAIATGHLLGDTGDFGNWLYVKTPLAGGSAWPIVPLEDDRVQGLMNQRYGGDYLGETSLVAAARAKGYATAVIGKLGPAGVQDVTDRDGKAGVVIDDGTGYGPDGYQLSPEIAQAIEAAGLPAKTPRRGGNALSGNLTTPGAKVANVTQQDWYVAVATQVMLPRFKAEKKPFVLVFWSRDPDGTQHNEGDSLNSLTPGINGPTTMAAIKNASNDLAALRAAVKDLGLEGDTDIMVTADHGFSVMARESRTSPAAKGTYADVAPGSLPPGFIAIDLAQALRLPLYDPAGKPIPAGEHPRDGALIGRDPKHPDIVLAPNGGTELIYLPGADPRATARRVVEALTRQDYTSAIFVRDALGPVPGALPTSAVGLKGMARTPAPDIAVSFRSFSTGCGDAEVCGAEIADSSQTVGQGIHGTLSRQDTHTFMAAVGPDFRKGYVDPAPVSNADWAPTAARLLGLDMAPHGHATGRVMGEALAGGGQAPATRKVTLKSKPAANGFVTVLNTQQAAGKTYYDAAGRPGRTIGLMP